MEEYVYSLNEQDFYDLEDIETKIEDVEMERESNFEPDEITHIYRATPIRYTHKDFITGHLITEDITNDAYEAGGEYSEDYISEIENHSKQIAELVSKYLDDNASQPNFYTVKNVEKISITDL